MSEIETVATRHAERFSGALDYSSFVPLFEKATPFTYTEAFSLEDATQRAKVFGSINIREMVAELGAKEISKETIATKQGTETIEKEYSVLQVSGDKLGAKGEFFLVKCSCNSTQKDHWIWIENKYNGDPITAIASTYRCPESILPHVEGIYRQGDVLLYKLKAESAGLVLPENENLKPLTKAQYLELVKFQS